jgi:hypothetical protein
LEEVREALLDLNSLCPTSRSRAATDPLTVAAVALLDFFWLRDPHAPRCQGGCDGGTSLRIGFCSCRGFFLEGAAHFVKACKL